MDSRAALNFVQKCIYTRIYFYGYRYFGLRFRIPRVLFELIWGTFNGRGIFPHRTGSFGSTVIPLNISNLLFGSWVTVWSYTNMTRFSDSLNAPFHSASSNMSRKVYKCMWNCIFENQIRSTCAIFCKLIWHVNSQSYCFLLFPTVTMKLLPHWLGGAEKIKLEESYSCMEGDLQSWALDFSYKLLQPRAPKRHQDPRLFFHRIVHVAWQTFSWAQL